MSEGKLICARKYTGIREQRRPNRGGKLGLTVILSLSPRTSNIPGITVPLFSLMSVTLFSKTESPGPRKDLSPVLVVLLVLALLPSLWHCHPWPKGTWDITSCWGRQYRLHFSTSISCLPWESLPSLLVQSHTPSALKPFAQSPQWVPQTERNPLSSGKLPLPSLPPPFPSLQSS